MATISGVQGYWQVDLIVNEKSTSTSNNTSSASWELWIRRTYASDFPMYGSPTINIAISGKTAYSGAPYFSLSSITQDGVKLLEGTVTDIAHNDDGTIKSNAASFTWSGSGFSPSSVSGSGSYSTSTIPRASEITCTSPNIGDVVEISVKKKSPSFTSTLTYKIGSLTGTIATKTSKDSVDFATSSIEDKIYALIPSDREIQGTIYCDTYSGSTKIGDTKSTTFKLYAVKSVCEPDVSATIVDTNTNVTNVMGSNTKFVRYISKPKVTINATAKKSASIKSYSINMNDGQTASKQTNTFSTMGSNKVSVSVTDTREYPNSEDYTLDMVDYIKLHINELVVSRPEGTSNEAILNLNGAYYNGSFTDDVSNSLSASFKYRLSGTSDEWADGGTLTPTITNNTFKISNLTLGEDFDYEQEYQFLFTFEDTFMIVNEYYTLEKGQEPFAIGDDEVYINGTLYLNDIPIKVSVVDEW